MKSKHTLPVKMALPKTNNTVQPITQAGALLAFCLAIASPIEAAEYLWKSSWGVLPNQVEQTLIAAATPPYKPVLTSDALTLQTPPVVDGVTDNVMCYIFPDLVMPSQLVIEAEVQYITGGSAKAGRPAVGISFTTGPGIGGFLGIDQGLIYLSLSQETRAATANVATDNAIHLYRIEVNAPTSVGSTIQVFQDGTLVMTGAIAANSGSTANWGSKPEIYFGDGTDWAYATSRWRSFRHNAASEPSKPVLFISNGPNQVWWPSLSGVSYNLQQAADLAGNFWTDVLTNIAGNGSTNIVPDTALRTNAQGFYRVEVAR